MNDERWTMNVNGLLLQILWHFYQYVSWNVGLAHPWRIHSLFNLCFQTMNAAGFLGHVCHKVASRYYVGYIQQALYPSNSSTSQSCWLPVCWWSSSWRRDYYCATTVGFGQLCHGWSIFRWLWRWREPIRSYVTYDNKPSTASTFKYSPIEVRALKRLYG